MERWRELQQYAGALDSDAGPKGLAEALHAGLAEFVNATRTVAIAQPPERATPSTLLRSAGAAPAQWWSASQFDGDLGACWRAALTSSERIVGLAVVLDIPAGDAPIVRRRLARPYPPLSAFTRTRRPYGGHRSVARISASLL